MSAIEARKRIEATSKRLFRSRSLQSRRASGNVAGVHPNAAEVAPHRLRNPLDVSLAKKELGWTPTIYLEEAIARLAQWLVAHKTELTDSV